MTTHTIRIPNEVREETYDSLLLEAYATGAVPYRDRENGTDTLDLTFKTKKLADAFVAKLPKVYEVEHLGQYRTLDAVVDVPTQDDPVDPVTE